MITRLISLLLLSTSAATLGEEVVIRSFPTVGFFIRSEPFTLSCSAINAISIRFRCNDRWMDESRQRTKEGLDERSGLRYLESSVNVTRREESGDEESCDCYAIGADDRTVKSERPATITAAYMRKHFEQSPSSMRVREGAQQALRCLPPLSHPLPAIEWTKDGQTVAADNYRLLASDGSLLLSSARLQDAGVYVCTARNVAAARSAPPAIVHVYVDGGWSEWTEWSGQCDVDCHQLRIMIALRGHQVMPTLSRRRVCNNPTPLNGGLTCDGEDEESSACPLECSVDGSWSEWSSWSECSSECVTKRSRACIHPPPLNGGRACAGGANQTSPCSRGVCAISPSWWLNERVVVVSLLSVLVLLVLLISLCVLLLCRQKTASATSIPYYGEIVPYKAGVHMEGVPGHHSFLPSPLPSMTIISNKSTYARCESGGGVHTMSRGGGESRQALLEGSSTGSSARKAFLTTTTSSLSEEDNYATVYECVGGDMVEGDCVLPARVDRDGGRLRMAKNGACLLVCEGALDSPTLIVLASRAASTDLPLMNDGEIAVSSLISVSSSSTIHPRFPFILTFPHSLHSIDEWSVALYSHSHYGWDRYEIDPDRQAPSPNFTVFDSNTPSLIHCTIPHYGTFLLCARPRKSHSVLRMRVAVLTPIDRRDAFALRVLVVPEGAGAHAIRREEESQRVVAECPLAMTIDGGPLCICVEDTASPSTTVDNYTEMDVATRSAHSFHVQSADASQPFAARLVLLQKGSSSSPLILPISIDYDYDQLVMTEECRVSLDFALPQSVKQRMAALLDPPSERDWTSLARSLSMAAFVHAGRTLSSPTTVLISLWEARREDAAHLSHALRLSGRPEIAILVDKCIR